MGFLRSIASGFRSFSKFNGVSSRSDFWNWILFFLGSMYVASRIGIGFGLGLSLMLLYPTIAVSIRRGRSVVRENRVLLKSGVENGIRLLQCAIHKIDKYLKTDPQSRWSKLAHTYISRLYSALTRSADDAEVPESPLLLPNRKSVRGLNLDSSEWEIGATICFDFSGASLKATRFTNSDNSKKSKYVLSNPLQFFGCDLRDSILQGCELQDSNFGIADLRGADFSGADLSNSDFRGADVRGTNFTDAILRNTDFGWANMHGAILDGANLDGANLHGAILDGANKG